MQVVVKELLKFFDVKTKENSGHATALVAVFGEELGAGLFCHYKENVEGRHTEIVSAKCTTGKKKGRRLDRWIREERENESVLYQVEIKNWSAHAIGGRNLRLDADRAETAEYKRRAWSDEWRDGAFRKRSAGKVLVPMSPPEDYEGLKVEPLVCYWMAMHPGGKDAPFFRVTPATGTFDAVWVFSMSAYLRTLTCGCIEIPMPDTEKRLSWINTMVQP